MVSNYKLVIDEINSLTDFSSIYCCGLIGINAEGFFNKNVINKNVENFNSEIKIGLYLIIHLICILIRT